MPLPTSYYAPGVPYVLDGRLYIAHRAQRGNWIDAQTVGAYTVATGTEPNRDDFSLVLMRHGVTIQVEHGQFVGSPTFSPNGTKLAWVTTDTHDVATLVSEDLSHARELGRLAIPFKPIPDEGISVSLVIENDGTVYYDIQDSSWSWKPGRAPVRAQMRNDESVRPAGFPGIHALVTLSPDHLWGAWEDTATRSVIVQKPGDPKSRFSMKVPTLGDGPPIVGWQTPTVATIDLGSLTNDGREKQIECDIVFQVCDVTK